MLASTCFRALVLANIVSVFRNLMYVGLRDHRRSRATTAELPLTLNNSSRLNVMACVMVRILRGMQQLHRINTPWHLITWGSRLMLDASTAKPCKKIKGKRHHELEHAQPNRELRNGCGMRGLNHSMSSSSPPSLPEGSSASWSELPLAGAAIHPSFNASSAMPTQNDWARVRNA